MNVAVAVAVGVGVNVAVAVGVGDAGAETTIFPVIPWENENCTGSYMCPLR